MPEPPSPASTVPADLSGVLDAPASEFAPYFLAAVADPTEENCDRLDGALLYRALEHLRQGTFQELIDEALFIHHGLESEAGGALRAAEPETFGRWLALGDLLADAARPDDPVALANVLASHPKYGRPLVEALAEHGGAMARKALRERLSITESQLSHLLRDLERAEVILRHRPEGTKEVQVQLGPVARELVPRTLTPPWVERVIEEIERARSGRSGTREAENLAEVLTELGAPSRAVAKRIAAALEALAPRFKTSAVSRRSGRSRSGVRHTVPPGASTRSLLCGTRT